MLDKLTGCPEVQEERNYHKHQVSSWRHDILRRQASTGLLRRLKNRSEPWLLFSFFVSSSADWWKMLRCYIPQPRGEVVVWAWSPSGSDLVRPLPLFWHPSAAKNRRRSCGWNSTLASVRPRQGDCAGGVNWRANRRETPNGGFPFCGKIFIGII